MAANTTVDQGHAPPKQGEKFRCSECGMELTITQACGCKESDHVHFHCCGKEMDKV